MQYLLVFQSDYINLHFPPVGHENSWSFLSFWTLSRRLSGFSRFASLQVWNGISLRVWFAFPCLLKKLRLFHTLTWHSHSLLGIVHVCFLLHCGYCLLIYRNSPYIFCILLRLSYMYNKCTNFPCSFLESYILLLRSFFFWHTSFRRAFKMSVDSKLFLLIWKYLCSTFVPLNVKFLVDFFSPYFESTIPTTGFHSCCKKQNNPTHWT